MSEIAASTKACKLYHFELIKPLRGFAAVTVLIYHAIAHFNWQNFPSHSIFIWFRRGWMGVDIFFVISGFVITLSALRQKRAASCLRFFGLFMDRRIRRIAPLYYLTLLLYAIMYVSWEDLSLNDMVSNLFFIHPWNHDYFGSINGANWSVGTEMQFYIFLALIIPFINYKNVLKIIILFFVITWTWRFGSYFIYG